MLKGRIGAIRSLRFSGDGRHLAMVEPADFVHVFETGRDYGRCQEIDLFGEVRPKLLVSLSIPTVSYLSSKIDKTERDLGAVSGNRPLWEGKVVTACLESSDLISF